jgi:uncharacterized membrane protein
MGYIDQYFLQPIAVEQGYNFVNTMVYALLALVGLYVIFKSMKYLKLRIDFRILMATAPFVLFGATLRALVDTGVMARNFWTVSPGIYLFVTFGFVLSLLVGQFLEKKKLLSQWQFFSGTVGLGMFLSLLIFYRSSSFENIWLSLGIIATVIISAVVFYFAFNKLKWDWISEKYGFSAFSAHLFDATVTAMILFFVGGWEKHPLPRFFIEKFGAFSFIPLKLVVIIPAIYVISKELDDKDLRNFLLIAITVLGMAEGMRNLISLLIV